MSNKITSLVNRRRKDNEKRKAEKEEKEIIETLRKDGDKSKDSVVTLDMNSRKLPRTVYLDIKTGAFKLGDDEKTMEEIEPSIIATPDNVADVLDWLESLDPTTIDKVVVDNGGFPNISTLDEFIESVLGRAKTKGLL